MIVYNSKTRRRFMRDGLMCLPTHEMFNIVTCTKCGYEGPHKRFFSDYQKKGDPYTHFKFRCPKCHCVKTRTTSILMEA